MKKHIIYLTIIMALTAILSGCTGKPGGIVPDVTDGQGQTPEETPEATSGNDFSERPAIAEIEVTDNGLLIVK